MAYDIAGAAWDGSFNSFRLLANSVPAMIAYYDSPALGYGCRFANKAYAAAYGLTEKSIIGRSFPQVIGEEAARVVQPSIDQVVKESRAVTYVRELAEAAGGRRWIEVNVLPHLGADGHPVGAFVIVTDITEHRRSVEALRESEERLAKFMQASTEGIAFHRDGIITDANPSLCELAGYTLAELRGRHAIDFIAQDQKVRVQAVLDGGQEISYESAIIRKDGLRIPVELIGRALVYGGETLRMSVVRDLRDRHAAQARIHHLAHHDALTGLPNRMSFMERLGQQIELARAAGRTLALLFVDLDHFKRVNDSLGHLVGDELLQTVAARISASLRAGDVVARFGGDEFMVMLTDSDRDDVGQVAHKLLRAIEVSFDVGGRSLSVTPSVGIAMFPHDGGTPTELIKNADTAMYIAKARGRANCQFFDPAVATAAYDALVLESQLTQALERDEFVLHYQPQVRAADGALAGIEALIRWNHPERGLLRPDAFIFLAEQQRVMLPISQWVLRTAGARGPRMARAGPDRRAHRDQPVQHAVPRQRLRRSGGAGARRRGRARRVDRARAHGAHAHGRPRRRQAHAAPAQGDGHAHLGRRFRHRLLVAGAPEGAADRRHEDRPLVRARPAARARLGGHRQGGDADGAGPVAHRGGRGCGNPGPAPVPGGAGLRPAAGRAGQRAGGGRRAGALDPAPRGADRLTQRRGSPLPFTTRVGPRGNVVCTWWRTPWYQ